MKEIKPCPFCGGEGEIVSEGKWSVWVDCRSCGAEGAWVDGNNENAEDDAINNWNQRVQTTANLTSKCFERRIIMQKVIKYCGKKCLLVCDGKCDKAWGVQSRPKIQLSEDENDYCFLADDELEIAPEDPLTYEGLDMEGKPTCDEEKMNRWCARECERSSINDLLGKIEIKDFSKRRYNYLSKND